MSDPITQGIVAVTGIGEVKKAITPSMPAAPPGTPPSKDASEAERAAFKERQKRLAAGGAASQILTGGAGLQGPASTATTRLLGL